MDWAVLHKKLSRYRDGMVPNVIWEFDLNYFWLCEDWQQHLWNFRQHDSGGKMLWTWWHSFILYHFQDVTIICELATHVAVNDFSIRTDSDSHVASDHVISSVGNMCCTFIDGIHHCNWVELASLVRFSSAMWSGFRALSPHHMIHHIRLSVSVHNNHLLVSHIISNT